jgi:DNA-binding winged helix-turn-helix (wHTH) protein
MPMQLLALLIENGGQIVDRDQIVNRLWGKGTHIDATNCLMPAATPIYGRTAMNGMRVT